MIPFKVILYATSVYALPASSPNELALPFMKPAEVALLWASVGLAVVTSFWHGVIVTIVTIAEDQGMWTFRFRIARYEHWWWTAVSTMLSISFLLIVLSFLSGNSDSLDVLTLCTATAVTVVRYAIPAWRNRNYIELRWLSWTGPSRTAISSKFRGKRLDWTRIQQLPRQGRVTAVTPSDEWGWAIRPSKGIRQDPTVLLQGLTEETLKISTNNLLKPCVYDDGYDSGQVSLLWGENRGFRRRVSRAVNSMPGTLLKSIPFTFDGFSGTGLCLAMGILGRNKGLAPSELVFDIDDRRKKEKGLARSNPAHKVTRELEATSTWYPRPNKVMRSFYQRAMEDQYSDSGPEFLGVAVELALILLDCPSKAIWQWLNQNLEQQSMEVNECMSSQNGSKVLASPAQLQTLYRASYTSMIISINYFGQDISDSGSAHRPDLTCFALLWLAEVGTAPDWWGQQWVQKRLISEACSLKGDWKRAASWLLGLVDVPQILDLNRWPYWADGTN